MSGTLKGGLVAIAMLGMAGAAGATPLIDTTAGASGAVVFFGEGATATYGQTFTVTGAETRLDSFSFWLNDSLNPDYVDFSAYVYAWDGAKATGPALFTSTPVSTTNNGGSDGWEMFAFDTGGIGLVSGAQYVAFLSASGAFDGQTGNASMWADSANPYAGGTFVFMKNGSNFPLLLSNNWSVVSGLDAAFIGSFSDPDPPVTPTLVVLDRVEVAEPASLALLGIGLVALGAARRRRSR